MYICTCADVILGDLELPREGELGQRVSTQSIELDTELECK